MNQLFKGIIYVKLFKEKWRFYIDYVSMCRYEHKPEFSTLT